MSETKQPEVKIKTDDWSNFADKYEKSIGITTRYVAKRLLKESPPFSNDSVVLDNACGTGIVTEEVQVTLRSQANVTIKVYAADAAPQMVRVLESKVEKAKQTGVWPNIAEVHTQVARAEELEESVVPSASITHAYMNFGIFFCSDPVKAARHVYRTLAPGGTAYFTTWADLGYENFMRKTWQDLEPDSKAFMLPFAHDWKKPDYVTSVLQEAGFSKDNIQDFQQPSFLRAKTVEEMAAMLLELFMTLIKGPGSLSDEAEKTKWRKALMENTIKDEHFLQEEDGVAVRMLANVLVCTK